MKSPRCLLLFLLAFVSTHATAASSSSSSWSSATAFYRGRTSRCSSSSSSSSSGISPWSCLPRGGAAASDDDDADEEQASAGGRSATSSTSSAGVDYATQLESVKSQVLSNSAAAIQDLRDQVMNQGKVVPDFGAQADMICNQALEDFASSAPAGSSSAAQDAVAYDRTLQQIEAALDAPLQVLYMKQLSFLRESALQRYRTSMKTSSGGGAGAGPSEYEAMLQADADFVQQAETLRRSVPTASGASAGGWDYEGERSFLQVVMGNLAESGRKAFEVQINASQQQQTTMQFLQAQQQMIQQLQMQLYGQSSPWNVGVAYRIPDTNFNLQGSYQQGRANVQLSCVPDEYAAFLGPNGFTNGVGPGNLGVSLNLSI
jgi:hypothetical protein